MSPHPKHGSAPVPSPTKGDGANDELQRWIEQHFAKLGTIGIEADGSITRLAYSDEESAAMAYVRAAGEAHGLIGHYDGVGNLILSTPEGAKQRFMIGSHLDSVPHGGNFDGAAGVIAGLETARVLTETGGTGSCGVDVVAWRGEEYTYNAVYKGSAAAFGLSSPQILHNIYGDTSLRDAIRSQGFDPSYIDEGRTSLDAEYIDNITGYIELHIEQGVTLERERADVGIVTSIAGDRRFLVVLEGRFDHSGATPMGARFRGDANLAMAYVQVRLDELARKHLSDGRVFTQTVGIVNADPEIDRRYPTVHGNSVTKVSGMGYFTLDLMSHDDEFLDTYAAEVHRVIWSTTREFNVKAFIEQTDASPGLAMLDKKLTLELTESADRIGAKHMPLPSGAGHDAVMVGMAEKSTGAKIPVSMLFVPCRGGISHSKEEYADARHVAVATEVMVEALRRLCA